MLGHPFRQSVVLRLHDPPRQLAIGGVPPEAVDGERLYVDPLLIHHLQTLRSEQVVARTAAAGFERSALDDIRDGDDAVAVDVDDADALSADRYLATRRCLRRLRADTG